jgi:PBP1b-binding outer membrane lipoprotein LpoB
MRVQHFRRYAIGIYGAMLLSGCVSYATTIASGPQDAMPSLAKRATGSWIEKTSSEDLLYVAAGLVDGAVYVYTYPQGRFVGTLTGSSHAHPWTSRAMADAQ